MPLAGKRSTSGRDPRPARGRRRRNTGDAHGYGPAGMPAPRLRGPLRHRLLAASMVVGVVLCGGLVDAADTRPRQPARVAAAPGKPIPQPVAQRAAASGRRIDPAVTPAGGGHVGHCEHCRRTACPQCRLPGTGPGPAHGPCQHGLCPAHCPVRPDVFGFYGTQWRKWPGSGVIQTSSRDEATPALPPKAEVPQATEESLQVPGGENPPPAAAKEREADDDADGGGDAVRAPLPRPLPEADDGAGMMPGPGRRARRVIFLDTTFDARFATGAEAGDAVGTEIGTEIGTKYVTEYVTEYGVDDESRVGTAAAGSGRRSAVNAVSAEMIAAGARDASDADDDPQAQSRSSTPWRRFLATDDADAAATGPR